MPEASKSPAADVTTAIAVLRQRFGDRLQTGEAIRRQHANTITWIPNQPPDAVIWVSWPKKTSKVPSDVTEDTIRAVALPMGLVDIKVCAVDDTWSGLKLVLRREARPQ